MGQERLSSLTLLHIHYDIDVIKIIDRFAALHSRHIARNEEYDLLVTGV